MPNVILVVLVELIICKLVERPPPEKHRLVDGQAKRLVCDLFEQYRIYRSGVVRYLQEQPVLQATKVLQMCVSPKRPVQVLHAKREA